VGSSVPVSLHAPQFLDRIISGHVRVCDFTLVANVSLAAAVDLHLDLLVHRVRIIFAVQLPLQHADVLLDHAAFLHNTAAVTIDSVEFHKDQVQAFLE